MDFSPDQDAAFRALCDFATSPRSDRRYVVMHGLAGSGKTTVLAEVARRLPRALLVAYTGKAADVLRRRVDVRVSTIHRAIYDFRGTVRDEEDPDRQNPVFAPRGEDLSGCLMLIDECSMVGRRVAEDILATGVRVIACGDPGQLPPVRDEQFFCDPDVRLTHIHRQALESPIIRQAHAIRAGRGYAADGDDFRVLRRAERDDLMGADILLCWTNRTRLALNWRRREYMGRAGSPMRAGEPVMALRNDYASGLFNGAVYTLVADVDPGDPTVYVAGDDGDPVEVEMATIEGFDRRFAQRRYEREWMPLAVAYAATIHKAQGSQYESVLIIDECDDPTIDRQLLYTGVTRAVRRCTVIGRSG